MDRRVVALAVVAGLIALGIAAWALAPRDDQAPHFRLEAVGGNATLDLAAARGKVVVLDLMAVSCTPCLALNKEVLQPLHARYANDTDVILWSVDVWGQTETAEELAALQEREGAWWPHALDNGTVFEAYQALSLPELYVIDPDGRIVFHVSGGSETFALGSLGDRLDEAIAEAKGGEAEGVGILQYGFLGLALAAGAAAVFSPCSIGLLPAYFGLLLEAKGRGPGPVIGGLQTAAGAVLVYGAIVLLLLPFGEALRPYLPVLGIVMGLLFIVLGALMLAGFDWGRLTARLRRPDGRTGYWAFGVAYGLASFGCTGPIFLPLLLRAFLAGPSQGVLSFLLYAGGVALLLVFIALLASLGRDGILRAFVAHSRWLARTVAVLWIGAGLYLVWFDLRAYA